MDLYFDDYKAMQGDISLTPRPWGFCETPVTKKYMPCKNQDNQDNRTTCGRHQCIHTWPTMRD